MASGAYECSAHIICIYLLGSIPIPLDISVGNGCAAWRRWSAGAAPEPFPVRHQFGNFDFSHIPPEVHQSDVSLHHSDAGIVVFSNG